MANYNKLPHISGLSLATKGVIIQTYDSQIFNMTSITAKILTKLTTMAET